MNKQDLLQETLAARGESSRERLRKTLEARDATGAKVKVVGNPGLKRNITLAVAGLALATTAVLNVEMDDVKSLNSLAPQHEQMEHESLYNYVQLEINKLELLRDNAQTRAIAHLDLMFPTDYRFAVNYNPRTSTRADAVMERMLVDIKTNNRIATDLRFSVKYRGQGGAEIERMFVDIETKWRNTYENSSSYRTHPGDLGPDISEYNDEETWSNMVKKYSDETWFKRHKNYSDETWFQMLKDYIDETSFKKHKNYIGITLANDIHQLYDDKVQALKSGTPIHIDLSDADADAGRMGT